MPQDLGHGVTHWAANESKAFFKWWDSPERKAAAKEKKAAYDKMTPYQQKMHSRAQRKAIRDKEGGYASIKSYGPGRDENNHRIRSTRQGPRKAGPKSEFNKRRQRRRARKQRMAGDRFRGNGNGRPVRQPETRPMPSQPNQNRGEPTNSIPTPVSSFSNPNNSGRPKRETRPMPGF